MNLSQETLEKIDKLVPRYPDKRSASLPLCHLVQEDQGYISKEAIEWIAERLELDPINIYEIVTFYPMLRTEPIGKCHIKVCRTLSCALAGAYEVRKVLRDALLKTDCDVWSNDDYTIEFVECLASCGTAPVVQVGETMHELISPEKAKKLAEEIRAAHPSGKKAASTGDSSS